MALLDTRSGNAMGYEIRRQVRAALPPGLLTTAERLLLLEIADLVNDKTRQGWPGREALAEVTDLSEGSIPSLLNRIAEKWMEIRVEIGKDPKGRPVYARQGHRTVFRFPETFDAGQTSMLDDGQTLGAERSTASGRASNVTGATFDDGQAKVGRSSTPSPQNSSKNQPQSLSQPTTPDAMLAALGVDEREREGLIRKIEEQNSVRGAGWWLTARNNGTLPAALEAARTGSGPGDNRPPWCGDCSDGARREIPDTSEYGGHPIMRPCPKCNPAVVKPKTSHGGNAWTNYQDPDRYDKPLHRGAGGWRPHLNYDDPRAFDGYRPHAVEKVGYQPYREKSDRDYGAPL